MGAREKLNELKWHPEKDLVKYEVVFTHRGAPKNRKKIQATAIKNIGKGFLSYESVTGEIIEIPYHRIIEISDKDSGEIIWRKK